MSDQLNEKRSSLSDNVVCPPIARWNGDLVGCGSSRVVWDEDDEVLDCLNCGLFFNPDAASVTRVKCPAILPTFGRERECGSMNLQWRENEEAFDCLDCGAHFTLTE